MVTRLSKGKKNPLFLIAVRILIALIHGGIPQTNNRHHRQSDGERSQARQAGQCGSGGQGGSGGNSA